MKELKLPIEQIHSNQKNPRKIKDHKFQTLLRSIKDFPEMLEARPIIIDENNIVLGGNMRLRAAKELGLTEVNVIQLVGLSEEKKKEVLS